MGLTKLHVDETINIYLEAWMSQDPNLIESIFTTNATYQEGGLAQPMLGRAAIRSYWQKKVVEAQALIVCKHLTTYIDGATAIVEWDAEFDDLVDNCRKKLREVAILEFAEGGLIESLREYWSSAKIA